MGQKAWGNLPRVFDPMREDTTPPPADGGVGMKVPQAGGGRINQPRPPPVCRPPPPPPCSRSPTATAPALVGFPCAQKSRGKHPSGTAPRAEPGVPGEGGAGRGLPHRPIRRGEAGGPGAPARGRRGIHMEPGSAAPRRRLQHQEQLQVRPRPARPARPALPAPPEPR